MERIADLVEADVVGGNRDNDFPARETVSELTITNTGNIVSFAPCAFH
jgi:hypothetical protein